MKAILITQDELRGYLNRKQQRLLDLFPDGLWLSLKDGEVTEVRANDRIVVKHAQTASNEREKVS